MGCEILIALPLEVRHHVSERFASRRSRGSEHPCTFGATPAPKSLIFDPYQLAAHGLSITPLRLVRPCSREGGIALVFGRKSRSNRLHQAQRLPRGENCCLLGIRHWQELLSQSKVILELLNDAVALTRGFFEFPAVHNLHRTSQVFYDSLFLQG